MGHALGLIHEHQRLDRNTQVIILGENIDKSMDSDFDVYSSSAITTYGVPYDLGSIMHYDSNVSRFSHCSINQSVN